MNKEKKLLKLQQKKERKKTREKRFSIIAFAALALAGLLGLALMVFAISRTDAFTSGFSAEALYGCWYREDDISCWRFTETEDGADVYFFVRPDTTTPFNFSSYTDVVMREKEGTITIYFGEKDPQTFTCSLKKDTLVLVNGDSRLVFKKGLPISERNKEIAATYPSKAEGEK